MRITPGQPHAISMNARKRPSPRRIAFVFGILITLGAIVWIELETWRLFDRLRPKATAPGAAGSVGTEETLESLEQLWFLSLTLVAAGGAVAVAIFYRRRIAPLRAELSESRTHLERHEKLASLGVFAAGIAHEIRNPLTAIKVRLFSLSRSVAGMESAREDVGVIRNEIDRLEGIVGEFLQFARPPDVDRRPVEIGGLVADVATLMEPELARRSVRLVREAVVSAWVLADASKLKQVLINLVQNAGQSIVGEGIVTLRVVLARRSLARGPADVAIVEVADNGQGMTPDVVQRLFDPFFTTKDDGTGLGLPIAARIVELHEGLIEYDTEPGRGTTFRIVLPRTRRREDDEEPIPNPAD